ncbi:NDP-hexose 2,3-dehydratase family protein, partial [Thomasclavelia ramosa]
CDQIQSEQSARFYRKRNRNMILLLDENEDVIVEKRFKWMTLSQIKELMNYRNLVNMDTRTVLSNLPLIKERQSIKEQAFLKSVTYDGYV